MGPYGRDEHLGHTVPDKRFVIDFLLEGRLWPQFPTVCHFMENVYRKLQRYRICDSINVSFGD